MQPCPPLFASCPRLVTNIIIPPTYSLQQSKWTPSTVGQQSPESPLQAQLPSHCLVAGSSSAQQAKNTPSIVGQQSPASPRALQAGL
mmetsp:Transcript_30283/g.63257  ORF Transcript_30283/g.63257 Transcript_30283/m.63257 type:complete len:87 (+) Transcript_30283:188-448(+)